MTLFADRGQKHSRSVRGTRYECDRFSQCEDDCCGSCEDGWEDDCSR